MRRRLLILIGALALAGAIGVAVALRADAAQPLGVVLDPARTEVDHESYDFAANPLGDAAGSTIAPGAKTSVSWLPFTPILPRTSNADPTIFVTDQGVQADWQMIVLDYATSAYGRLQVFERAQGMTQANIDQWAEPGYCTSCARVESVTLTGGQRATLLATPETTTAVHWIQGEVQIDVVGPYGTLTRDEAIAVANDLSTQ